MLPFIRVIGVYDAVKLREFAFHHDERCPEPHGSNDSCFRIVTYCFRHLHFQYIC
jgi:hypothetical protein